MDVGCVHVPSDHQLSNKNEIMSGLLFEIMSCKTRVNKRPRSNVKIGKVFLKIFC
jgi:hypothetical protein